MEETTKPKRQIGRAIGIFFLRLLAVLGVTLVVLALVLLGAVYVFTRGGSETAREKFVLTVKETSAIGFLADIFLSPEEVDAIVNRPQVELDTQMDTSPWWRSPPRRRRRTAPRRTPGAMWTTTATG